MDLPEHLNLLHLFKDKYPKEDREKLHQEIKNTFLGQELRILLLEEYKKQMVIFPPDTDHYTEKCIFKEGKRDMARFLFSFFMTVYYYTGEEKND